MDLIQYFTVTLKGGVNSVMEVMAVFVNESHSSGCRLYVKETNVEEEKLIVTSFLCKVQLKNKKERKAGKWETKTSSGFRSSRRNVVAPRVQTNTKAPTVTTTSQIPPKNVFFCFISAE